MVAFGDTRRAGRAGAATTSALDIPVAATVPTVQAVARAERPIAPGSPSKVMAALTPAAAGPVLVRAVPVKRTALAPTTSPAATAARRIVETTHTRGASTQDASPIATYCPRNASARQQGRRPPPSRPTTRSLRALHSRRRCRTSYSCPCQPGWVAQLESSTSVPVEAPTPSTWRRGAVVSHGSGALDSSALELFLEEARLTACSA